MRKRTHPRLCLFHVVMMMMLELKRVQGKQKKNCLCRQLITNVPPSRWLRSLCDVNRRLLVDALRLLFRTVSNRARTCLHHPSLPPPHVSVDLVTRSHVLQQQKTSTSKTVQTFKGLVLCEKSPYQCSLTIICVSVHPLVLPVVWKFVMSQSALLPFPG